MKLGSFSGKNSLVNDVRGKKLTDRNVFRYAARRFAGDKLRYVARDVQSLVREKQAEAIVKDLDKTVYRLDTERASRGARNAGEMDARRKFRDAEYNKKKQQEADSKRDEFKRTSPRMKKALKELSDLTQNPKVQNAKFRKKSLVK